MKYKFNLDKKNFDVQIASNSTFHSETEVKVNKKPMNIQIGEYDDETIKSFFLNNKLYQVEIVKDQEGYPTGIFVNDDYYPASLKMIDSLFYYQSKPVESAKSGIMTSFIPGNIKKVFFTLNSRVKEGDIVLIHEAMKMENEIRAPKSGIIKSIGVEEGENILANHVLFEIE